MILPFVVQEVRYSEDIDFKFPMRTACSEEIKRFCANIEPGMLHWQRSEKCCLAMCFK